MGDIKPVVLDEEEIVSLLTTLTEEEISLAGSRALVPIKKPVFFEGVPASARVKDLDGKEYIDFTSQAWTLSVGFCHPDVCFAAIEQIKHLTHIRNHFFTVPRVKLINKLVEIAPGDLEKVVLNTQGGSVAIEAALKLAMINKPRAHLFVTAWGGYHGNTLATFAATHYMRELVRFTSFGLDRFVKIPYPYCYRCPFNLEYPDCSLECLEFSKKMLDKGVGAPLIGILIEPILGSGGDVPPPPEYLKELRKFCDEARLLLIFDESQTAFGRVGRMFASELFDVVPDIMALTKAIGGGFPVGATLARKKLKSFSPAEQHSTFSANPVAFAAALINIHVIQKLNLPRRAEEMGKYVRKRLEELQEKYEVIGDIRGPGLFIGVELVKDRKTKEPANKVTELLQQEALQRGLILGLREPDITLKGDIIRNLVHVKPPLVITQEEVDRGIEIFEESLKAALSQAG